jgi:ElaB/YqjD/DUF883 family membrane-anchored ribosome-binding protein
VLVDSPRSQAHPITRAPRARRDPKEHAMSESLTGGGREQLAADMKSIIADAEELLKATASATGERILAARARAEETLKSARERLANSDDAVLNQMKDVAKTADDYVREHPWGAVGIAAVAGLLLGVLISRR